MPKKKTADEIPPEPQELPAEQTEGAETPSEETTEPIDAETSADANQDAAPGSDMESEAKPKRSRSKAKQTDPPPEAELPAEIPPEDEPDAVGLPVADGYPAEAIPDIVSFEFETGGEDEDIPPEADVPYGEENGEGEYLPAGAEVPAPMPDSIPAPEGAFASADMTDLVGELKPQPEAPPVPEPAPEPEQPPEPALATPPPEAPVNERRAFFGQNFRELDRGLTPEQRQEWNSIYASYRGRSVMSGQIFGVDRVRLQTRDRNTGEMIWRRMNCAVVIPFRVRILIPESEMWMPGDERPGYVLRNISGANIDFVIISVDRESGLAIGSRRMALPSRRYFFSTQPDMNRPGSRISCDVLVVGPRRCLVSCNGYDLDLTQREMSYTAIADLRDKYHSGDTLDCIVKEYDRRKNHLAISVKETVPNPFDGADFRHPEGSQRYAIIAGKYAGGVFCNLPDGVTIMCNYAFHYDDSAFKSGDRVLLVIQRYDMEKKQIYGKIVAKV